MPYLMSIISLSDGSLPFERLVGRPIYLAAYDLDGEPVHDQTAYEIIDEFPGVTLKLRATDDNGGHFTLTDDPRRALLFGTLIEAVKAWNGVSRRKPLRANGLPNKPLTGFCVEYRPCPPMEPFCHHVERCFRAGRCLRDPVCNE